MKNIEIKVRVADRAAMLRLVKKLGARKRGVLRQRDTYFFTPNGRLKLREESGRETVDLVSYFRSDEKHSRLSEYEILSIIRAKAKSLKGMLTCSLGIKVVVKKMRILFFYRHTRIHLDRVDGLGDFLELETVVSKQKLSSARKEHAVVVRALGLAFLEKIPVSYSDLLIRSEGTPMS